jgi:hypothetical protein
MHEQAIKEGSCKQDESQEFRFVITQRTKTTLAWG